MSLTEFVQTEMEKLAVRRDALLRFESAWSAAEQQRGELDTRMERPQWRAQVRRWASSGSADPRVRL